MWLAASAILLLTCVMVNDSAAQSAARGVDVGYRNVGIHRGVAIRRGILPGAAFQTRGIREAEGLRAVPYRGFVRRPLARPVAGRRGWDGWSGLGWSGTGYGYHPRSYGIYPCSCGDGGYW
jgi:hypothetical protein